MCFLIYGKISKNIFCYKTPPVAASEHIYFSHYLKKGVGGYILAGGGWWWIYFGWWWVVVDGGVWWHSLV